MFRGLGCVFLRCVIGQEKEQNVPHHVSARKPARLKLSEPTQALTSSYAAAVGAVQTQLFARYQYCYNSCSTTPRKIHALGADASST